MEITTAWGTTWRVATNFEIVIILVIILLILSLFYLIKYNQILKTNKIHENQMLLFRAKQLSLTNFQYKVLKGISDHVNLKKPYDILKNPDKFEKSIGNFIHYYTEYGESHKNLLNVSRDIVITYEKIYHHSEIRQPLHSFTEIEDNKLVYFCTKDKNVFIGKLTKDINNNYYIQLFRDKNKIQPDKLTKDIEIHFWRSGDAEYMFNTKITNFENSAVYIEIPDNITRKNAVRTPFIDVILPCTIIFSSSNILDGEESINSTIFKLNSNEFIIRTTAKLNFSKNYKVEFSLNDFVIATDCSIISDRTITQDNTNYYTFKFKVISEAAKNIIDKYITDRM